MNKIQAELRSLKKKVIFLFLFLFEFIFKIDEETLKQKKDEKINILMQERDYFKKEAIKLDSICKDQEKKLKEIKQSNKIMSDDKAYYENFILGLYYKSTR